MNSTVWASGVWANGTWENGVWNPAPGGVGGLLTLFRTSPNASQ